MEASPCFRASDGRMLYKAETNLLAGARVPHLFFLGRPLTITRFVIAFIIYAVNRVFWSRFFTHIIQKIGEPSFLIQPTFADSDTPTAIAMIGSIFRVITTLFHGSIRVILKFIIKTPPVFIIYPLSPRKVFISTCKATGNGIGVRWSIIEHLRAVRARLVEGYCHNLIIVCRLVSVKEIYD